MSSSPAPVFDALATQLALALDRYDADVAAMVDTWLDLERYHQVSADIEEIRMLCGDLPHLSMPWVELLIAHAELVHWLWRLQFEPSDIDAAGLAALRERHAASLAALRGRCAQAMAQRQPAR